MEWEGGNTTTNEPEENSCARQNGHLNHDLELQKLANELAQELIANTGRAPNKEKIAGKLAVKTGISLDTVLRRIRVEWKKPIHKKQTPK